MRDYQQATIRMNQTEIVDMAVRTILTRAASHAQLATDLGVGLSTLDSWLQNAIDRSHYGDVLQALFEEVGVLRKENAELRRVVAGRRTRQARSG